MTNHLSTRELSDLIANDLPPERQGLAEDHVNCCDQCLEQLERLQRPQQGNMGFLGELLMKPPCDLPDTIAWTDSSQPTQEEHFPSVPGYEILGKLGKGGMGIVYKARQISVGREVALKMIRNGTQGLDRFENEIRTAVNLHHSNIVPIYEVGTTHGQPFFTMKLIDHATFKSSDKRSLDQTVHILMKVARAVHYLHECGILHRDLKPANILIDECGEPFVTDFGIARRFEDNQGLTSTGAIVGTLDYMAPEIARGERFLTPKADVYSLGVMLYQLLTGRLPFRELRQITDDELPLLPRILNPTVNRDLEAICMACLQKAPEDRYASAEAVAEDLGRYLAGERVSVRPAGVLRRTIIRRRRVPSFVTRNDPFYAAVATFVGHSLIFVFVQLDCPVWLAWATLTSYSVASWLVLRRNLYLRLHLMNEVERGSMTISFGLLLATIALFLALGPLSISAPIRAVLPWYPAMTVLVGFAIFAHGITHWGWFFVAGLGFMFAGGFMRFYLELAPLFFALLSAIFLSWCGFMLTRFTRSNN